MFALFCSHIKGKNFWLIQKGKNESSSSKFKAKFKRSSSKLWHTLCNIPYAIYTMLHYAVYDKEYFKKVFKIEKNFGNIKGLQFWNGKTVLYHWVFFKYFFEHINFFVHTLCSMLYRTKGTHSFYVHTPCSMLRV